MYIYSIMGYGKGKTESAIGITIRALANNHKVLFTQFLKDGHSSEVQYLKDKITIMTSNTEKLVLPKNKTAEDVQQVAEFLTSVEQELIADEYDLLVLDEILVALDMDMVSHNMVTRLLNMCKNMNVDVYMTGRVRSKDTRLWVETVSDSVTNAY